MSSTSARILVVDDTPMNRDILCKRLVSQGHEPIQAVDGEAALAMLAESDYDAVLLDIMMPKVDGYQVLEAMKADERLKRLPVIMITAVDAIESVLKCIRMGADDYLTKPFNGELLRARLHNVLEKRHLLLEIEEERQRADDLLRVILPEPIVAELKATNEVRPRRYENVAVMFCDIVGFTGYCDKNDPELVVKNLQELTVAMEERASALGVQKVKSIGDAFMGASGLLAPAENPVLDCVRLGLEMVALSPRLHGGWQVRVGINVGPVVAGVVGRKQYLFDVWGDTVNTAARVEGHGVPGAVNVSAEAWRRIDGHCRGESLGLVTVKGKGAIELYRVDGVIGDGRE